MEPTPSTIADDLLPTRYSLLSRLKDWEDNESWRVFFDTYWRLIYSAALRSGLTKTEAEEVVQETIICVAKNIQNFKRDRSLGSFKGWLCNLTRWRIADQLRKRTGVLLNDLVGAGNVSSCKSAPEVTDETVCKDWEQEWQSHLLESAKRRVKSRVSEEQYQVFDLYVAKEWPVSRICATLGVSATSVYLAKHRIARLLRSEVRRLEKEWDSE